jgi:hypothetical protein
MNKSNFYLYQKKLFEACHKIAIKKGNDYARGDDPFANFRTAEAIGVKPIKGILIRMMDKIQRLNNYGVVGKLDNESAEDARLNNYGVVGKLDNESAEDAVMDIINYASLIGGLICEKEGKELPTNATLRGYSDGEGSEGNSSGTGGVYWSEWTPTYRCGCRKVECDCDKRG